MMTRRIAVFLCSVGLWAQQQVIVKGPVNGSGAVQVDGSGVTQPISGTVTANAGTGTFNVSAAQSGNWAVRLQDGSGNSIASTSGALNVAIQNATLAVTQSGTWNVGITGTATITGAVTQSGTWTMQPGNTANTTAWLVTGTGGTFPITAASLPLPTGASTSAKQPALGTAGTASSDVITIQGITSMTPINATISAGTAVIGHVITDSGSTTVVTGTTTISGTVTANAGTGTFTVTGAGGTFPVTGTFWQATQPVSGTFWQTTQPVSGTFYQTLQPVNVSTWGGGTVGAMANYGTSPGAVLVPGINAYVTNSVTIGTMAALVAGSATIGKVDILGNTGAAVDQAPGSAAPANAVQVAGTDGTDTRVEVFDACAYNTWTYYPINVSSNTQIIAGSSGKNVYVCKMYIQPAAAAVNVELVESATSGNACATSPTGMMGGNTAALGANVAINGGFVLPADKRAWAKTATSGDAMCIFVSAAAAGILAYVQF